MADLFHDTLTEVLNLVSVLMEYVLGGSTLLRFW